MLQKLYQLGVRFRNYLFDVGFLSTYQSSLPVISVGNISVGGTGKTPFVIFLVNKLREEGYFPCILSRGYRGVLNGPVLLHSQHTYRDVGDEPLILARHAPVVISKKRVSGAQFIEKNNLGNIIVLDDGFQHRYLKRNLDIVLLNATDAGYVTDVIHNRVLPYGTLREPKSSLLRATCVILSDREGNSSVNSSPLVRIIPSHIPHFSSCLNFIGVYRGEVQVSPREVIALSTIASPGGFHTILEKHGFQVKEKITLKDHAALEREFLIDLINRKNPVVVTEKDFVKIPDELKANFYVAKIEVTLKCSESSDQELAHQPVDEFMKVVRTCLRDTQRKVILDA